MYTEQFVRYWNFYSKQYPDDEIRKIYMTLQAAGSWEEDFSPTEVRGVIEQLIKEDKQC